MLCDLCSRSAFLPVLKSALKLKRFDPNVSNFLFEFYDLKIFHLISYCDVFPKSSLKCFILFKTLLNVNNTRININAIEQ